MFNVHEQLPVERIVQVGIRDFSEEEANLAKNSPRITSFYDGDLADRIFNGESWYQSAIYRNLRYHFLTAVTRETFNKIGGFSYDYTIGNAYDDNDFVLRIDSLGIHTNSVQHTDVKCGGVHLYHTPSEIAWGSVLPLNDLVFEEKKKHYENTGEYKEILKI
jgi:GT2 family glycosyltransferase